MVLPTYGPPLSSRTLKVAIALSFNFLIPICFLIGVTKFLTCEFKWDPTLSLSCFKIYNPLSLISSLPWLKAVLRGHTILVRISISLGVELSSSIIYLQTLYAIKPQGCFSSTSPSKQVTRRGLQGSSMLTRILLEISTSGFHLSFIETLPCSILQGIAPEEYR